MKTHGYWTRGEGLEILKMLHDGKLRDKQEAAELAGVPYTAVEQSYLRWRKRTEQPVRPKASKPRAATSRSNVLEGLVTGFMKYAEDFAAAAIKATQQDLIHQLAEKDRKIDSLGNELRLANEALTALKATAKAVDAGRAREIMTKAGVAYGE